MDKSFHQLLNQTLFYLTENNNTQILQKAILEEDYASVGLSDRLMIYIHVIVTHLPENLSIFVNWINNANPTHKRLIVVALFQYLDQKNAWSNESILSLFIEPVLKASVIFELTLGKTI